MGGWGNLKDTSVKVNLKESGDGRGLDVVGGRGAGRGGEDKRSWLKSSTGRTRASLISETETVACLRLALTPRTGLPCRLEVTE